MNKKHIGLFLIFLTLSLYSQLNAQDTLSHILGNELNKIRQSFKNQEKPPYFIDFRLNENNTAYIQYSSGNLVRYSPEGQSRLLTIGLRVGSYVEDNTSSQTETGGYANNQEAYSCLLPLDNDSIAISQIIRNEMDLAYKNSLQQYKALQTNNDNDNKKDKPVAFSVKESSVYYEKPLNIELSKKEFDNWKNTLREISGILASDTNVIMNEVVFGFNNERIYYLNTEGTSIIQNRPQCQINILAVIRTSEGNVSPLFKTFTAKNFSDLPARDQLIVSTKNLLLNLQALRIAPQADPYAGPSIFSSEAAGVIFHEIFGHRVEGQRLRNDYDGQTFLNKVNEKVLDDNLTIVFDPTLAEFDGHPLFGSYKYDDQGVKGETVIVVDHGILKNFLMSRTPYKNRELSNGHGRAQAGMVPFSRQSNLIVKFKEGQSDAALRKMLLKECARQGKTYGYFIKEVYGGFTNTTVFSPQIFNILPTMVYRVYTDNRPDELVRGVNFIGTPLTVFSEIIANGDQYGIFNGYCGAESGAIPVSTVCPQLLIKKIETQKIPEIKFFLPTIKKPE